MSLLVDFALRFVRETGAGYAFVPAARRGLALALDDLFRARVDVRSELQSLLALGLSFERRHASPGIARSIVQWIAREPRALRALGVRTRREMMKLRRCLLEVGTGAKPAAPRHDAPPPRGTVKLQSFLDPGRERPRRAMAGSKRPAPRRPRRGVVLA